MAEKAEKQEKVKGLVAYAAFEFGGRSYKAGDTFVLPAGYERDPAFEEFRAMEKKNALPDQQFGMAFTGRDGKRQVLPVKEA